MGNFFDIYQSWSSNSLKSSCSMSQLGIIEKKVGM
jgi:hypothetical protein